MNGREKRKRLNVRKEVKKGKSCGPCWYPAALHVSREYRRQHALLDRVISHVHGPFFYILHAIAGIRYVARGPKGQRGQKGKGGIPYSVTRFLHPLESPGMRSHLRFRV